MSEVVESMSSQDALKLLGAMQTAIEATTSSAAPLLTKYVLFLACIQCNMIFVLISLQSP